MNPLTLFRALPLVWRLASFLGLVAVVLGGIGGLYGYVHHQGYVAGYSDASEKYEKAEQAMVVANQKAADEAAKALAEAQIQLQIKEATLDDYVKALDIAASQDPHGAELGLGVDSLRRLNAIK
jgi:hypothetical protein